jgi:predicted nucleotidyltransferase
MNESPTLSLATIPNLGIFIPIMGTKRALRSVSLAGALFTPVQQRVLGLIFGQPDRRFQSAELIRLARGGTGAVHRQLKRLAVAGLVTVTRVGNQLHYQARADSPVFAELRGLITKTAGLAEPLRRALAPLAGSITAAFVYGSVAKGSDRAGSDIDLMVISDSLRYADVFAALQSVEAELGRPINPTVMTSAVWRTKRTRKGSFVARIASQPRTFVVGTERELR